MPRRYQSEFDSPHVTYILDMILNSNGYGVNKKLLLYYCVKRIEYQTTFSHVVANPNKND